VGGDSPYGPYADISYLENVAEEHFMFVKRALTYLAVSIIQGRRGRGSGGERGRGGYRSSGWVSVGLN